MKKPIPPDLLAQLHSHQQYTETLGKEGKKLEARGLDLSELDLSSRDLACANLPEAKFDNADLRKANLSSAWSSLPHYACWGWDEPLRHCLTY